MSIVKDYQQQNKDVINCFIIAMWIDAFTSWVFMIDGRLMGEDGIGKHTVDFLLILYLYASHSLFIFFFWFDASHSQSRGVMTYFVRNSLDWVSLPHWHAFVCAKEAVSFPCTRRLGRFVHVGITNRRDNYCWFLCLFIFLMKILMLTFFWWNFLCLILTHLISGIYINWHNLGTVFVHKII